MKYMPQLDGLRALFVTAVFLCHCIFLDCGWIGVQAFFVLSGFLITGVLLQARQVEIGSVSYFRNFYARRALRIFPVYIAYTGVVMLAGQMNVGGAQMGEAVRAHNAEHVPYLLTYTYNFFHVTAGPGSPFYAHLWSLSIEEQFYVLWPLCAWFLSRGSLLRLCVLLVLAGPLVRMGELLVWQQLPPRWGGAAKAIYFLTPSHLDAFALGALLNFRGENSLVGRIAAIPVRKVLLPMLLLSSSLLLAAKRAHLGMSLSSFGWPLYLSYFHAPVWGYTVLNLFFFVLIANAGNLALLNLGGLQRLGKVSYGFFIFHLPVIWIAAQLTHINRGAYDLPNLIVALGAFAATWLLAEASYRLLESPLLRFKHRFRAEKTASFETAAA
jgi:peptidoglycan/LPS O-acetylase OafA/YrhL